MVTADSSVSKKLAQAFFSPAVALMGRLDIARKFALLGLMLLAAMVVVVYSLYVSLNQDIRFLQRELEGLNLIEPFSRVVQTLQQHRGLSAGALGGDETMRGSRAGTERDVTEAFAAMEARLPPGMASGEDMRHIGAEWKRLREAGLAWTAAENLAAHTRLLNRIRSFKGMIADEYALILDPELNTYYLIDTIVDELPHTLEYLGRLRAYGTAVLASKQITVQQKIELNILIDRLDHALEKLDTSFDKAGRYNPALQGLISAAFRDIADSARQITGLVTSDILAGHFAARPADFFNLSTAAIDRCYAQLCESLLPAARTLIEARIARAESMLYFSVGIAALLFLMAAYFSVGTARVVVDNIRSLVSSAHTFAGGDLNERIELGARDEFGQVGDSFNEMAEGFSALLKVSRGNEVRLQDLSAHLEERVEERTRELNSANKRLQEEIIERKKTEEQIRHLAFYDVLTGLPNRRLFLDRFHAALAVSVRHNHFGAVLFIDMDRFKLLNDTLGHDYGDLLLVEVAVRIKSCVREMDTVARLGGDEFVVLIEDVSDGQEEASHKAGLVAEKIRESLACPYHLNGHDHQSSPSIGVSLYRGNEVAVKELLQRADMAMYQAKNDGRNAVRFFDPVMQKT